MYIARASSPGSPDLFNISQLFNVAHFRVTLKSWFGPGDEASTYLVKFGSLNKWGKLSEKMFKFLGSPQERRV